MRKMRLLLLILLAALVTGIVLTATGHLYPNVLDRLVLDRVLECRSQGYDHALLKLTELWSTDNYLEAAAPIVAYGDEKDFAWLESSTRAMILSEGLVSSLKYIVGRRRPDGSMDRKNSSFPSSHTSSAFAFAAVLAGHYPEYGTKAFEIAVFVGISRMYLERHYPSDVVSGAAIGLAAALASEVYFSWLHFDRDTFLDVLLFMTGSGPPSEIETPLFRNEERID